MLRGRAIHMDDPFFILHCFYIIASWCELRNKLCQGLSLYSMSWLVSDVKLTEFDSPLDQTSYGFQFVHGFLERVVCHNIDYMGLEVVSQLLGSRDKCEG